MKLAQEKFLDNLFEALAQTLHSKSNNILIRAKRAKISVALFSFREDKIRELRANISGELTNTISL